MSDLNLLTLAEQLEDLEDARIAAANRRDAMGRNIGAPHPHQLSVVETLAQLEHETVLELRREWRKHPLAAWAKEIPGAGEKLMARLIAVIGDPSERPNPAKLWAYCGVGNPELHRRKGMTQEEVFACGNPEAKKRAYLLGAQFRRTPGSPYRDVYDERRKQTADRLHEKACVRCGPSGKPAQPGTPWSAGHQDADAVRIVVKRFLLDLWKEARAGHSAFETQTSLARAGQATYDSQTRFARAGVVA